MTTSSRMPRPLPAALSLAALVAALLLVPSFSAAKHGRGHGGGPDVLALPAGWQPEGIASGRGKELFVGSTATGAVFRLDARRGTGSVLVPAHDGRSATGLKAGK